MVCIPSDTPLEKTNFPFVSYNLFEKGSEVEMGTCIDSSPSAAHADPVPAAISVSSYASQSYCEYRPSFLGVLYLL